MASTRLITILAVLLVTAVAPALTQAEELTASVDRQSVYANETFQLELQAETRLDFNLFSMFNPRDLNIPLPDTEPLRKSFRILDRNQHMAIQTENGVNEGTVTWTFLLTPREPGTLTIPSLAFRELQSEPIQIKVIPGVAPPEEDRPPEARLEVALSEEDVYTQQQVIMTQRVFYKPPLIRGKLSTPEILDATVRTLGEQREFRAQRDGREWQVVERRFALVPQSPGTLMIPEQTFRARKRNRHGDLEFIHVASPAQQLQVNPPPDAFSGELWLPARELEIKDEWSSPRAALRAGDSVTRAIRIRAVGVAPQALPRIDIDYPESLREYPQPWESESRLTDESIEAHLHKRSALVPIEPGTVRLPPVSIKWWDVAQDRERITTIDASEIQIAPARGADADEEKSSPTASGEKPEIRLPHSPGASLPPLWFWLAIVLATGWLLTGIAWWRNRHLTRASSDGLSPEEKANRERFQALCERAERGEADTLTLLPRWASSHFSKPGLKTVGDVTAYLNDPTFTREIQALERHLFAGPEHREPWNGAELVAALRRLAGKPLNH